MLSKIKSYTDSYLGRIARRLPRFHPNIITVIGLLPAALFAYFLIKGDVGWAMVCYLGNLLDLVDGAYARATGQVTAFGGVLDSTLDRIADAVIIMAFACAGLVTWPLAIAVLVASYLISYVRAAGSNFVADKSALAVGPIERGERLVIILLGLLAHYILARRGMAMDILTPVFLVLLALSVITIIRRLYVVKVKARLP